MPSLFVCSVLVLCSILKLVKSEDLQNCMTLTRENYYDELKSNNFLSCSTQITVEFVHGANPVGTRCVRTISLTSHRKSK